ncbi:MerR family transcriptional regulator [Micromonospora sp. CPCC 206061]|uniref:MerR family transcriptional regulator n=1 Tax=Micromonospora sp. CPCC 206061 TaxID=3122410 RepID=UPI002FF3CBED
MHIGELAERAGLSVKTVRYYSDLGLVPESSRTHSGHRRYDAESAVRLDLVRTLRELGLDLATIRRVLDQEADLGGVAARHASAIDAQIRVLRVRRAVLRALARSNPSPQEVDRVNRIARATAEERRRIISEFLDSIFDGVPVNPELEARLRSATPELPDEPTDEQIEAWLELSELVSDPEFRSLLRGMSAAQQGGEAAEPAVGAQTGQLISEQAGAAVAAGIDPASAEATPVLDRLVSAMAEASGRADDSTYRRAVLDQLEIGTDPRPERYWQLMAVINGWPAFPPQTPNYVWLRDALRARA